MPRWVAPLLLILVTLALVPFACVARARVVRSLQPRLHLVQDMDNQASFKGQQANGLFADGRAMRQPVPGTVARGRLGEDPLRHRGFDGARYADTIPLPVTGELLRRGRVQYDIFCAPCHGLSGHGDGMIARRADRLQQGSWVPPSSFHTEPVYSRPVGHVFNTITNGIRNMPAYRSQIEVADRWAIVAYVEALQRSQRARLEDVPPEQRSSLR